jgi:hypothetical protein
MHESETFGMCLPGNLDCVFRVEVWPARALIARFEPALGDEEICIPREYNRIVANTSISTISEHFSVNFQTVSKTGNRMDERKALNIERQGMPSFG